MRVPYPQTLLLTVGDQGNTVFRNYKRGLFWNMDSLLVKQNGRDHGRL